ncbi:hypothetical protein NO1_0898 [Candidatus Termititenax aidoneus]|uniref:Uncharacterized protein n=1 Tax=Termititenax aidoneus TaxID=2218524 RepID=A0A388TA46_TERA1|nr:hypothetical protein NO1_0898 [Candidatus Termititenax aidoneus]
MNVIRAVIKTLTAVVSVLKFVIVRIETLVSVILIADQERQRFVLLINAAVIRALGRHTLMIAQAGVPVIPMMRRYVSQDAGVMREPL